LWVVCGGVEEVPGSVEKLEIWREAGEIVKGVFGLSQNWPQKGLYRLTNQARRAVVSVPANLAEGLGRGAPGEMARFAQIAQGSLHELDRLLYLAAKLGYGSQDLVAELPEKVTTLAKRSAYQPSVVPNMTTFPPTPHNLPPTTYHPLQTTSFRYENHSSNIVTPLRPGRGCVG